MFGLFEHNFRKILLYIYFFLSFMIDCETFFSWSQSGVRMAVEIPAHWCALLRRSISAGGTA